MTKFFDTLGKGVKLVKGVFSEEDPFKKDDNWLDGNINKEIEYLFTRLYSEENIESLIEGFNKKMKDIKIIYDQSLWLSIRNVEPKEKKEQLEVEAKKKLEALDNKILAYAAYFEDLKDKKYIVDTTIHKDSQQLKKQNEEINIEKSNIYSVSSLMDNQKSIAKDIKISFDNIFEKVIPNIIYHLNLLDFYKFQLKWALENNKVTDEEKTTLSNSLLKLKTVIEGGISDFYQKSIVYSYNMRMLNEDNTQKKDFNDLYDNLKKFIDYIKKNLDEDKVLKILLDKSKTNQQIIEELSGQIVGTTTDGALQLLSSARSAGESEKIPDTSTDIVAHGGENQYSAYVVGTHMYNILKAIDEDSIFKKEIKEDFSQKLKIFVAAPNINTAKDLFYFLSKNKMSPSYIFTALSEIIGEDKLIKVMTDLCNELYSPVKKNYIINTDTEKATAALLLDMSHYIYKLRGEDNMYSTTSFNLLEKIRVIVLENKKFTNRRDILIDMIIKKIENISKEMDFDYIVNILGILFDKKDLNTRDSIEGIIRILNPVQTRKLVNVLIKTKNSIPPQNTSNPLREWIDRILNEITQVKDSKRLNYGKRVKS